MNDIQYSNFLLAGTASVGATVFTNPLEVSNQFTDNSQFVYKIFFQGYQNEIATSRRTLKAGNVCAKL